MKKIIYQLLTLLIFIFVTSNYSQELNNSDNLDENEVKHQVQNDDPLKKEFRDTMKANRLKNLKAHSYCIDHGETYGGHEISSTKRIASVTKLYTTLLAIDSLDLHETYQTYFYYNKKNLHIVGGKDPWFESEKLFYLIQELNQRGITQLDTITFNSDFYANTRPSNQYIPHQDKFTAETLSQYFNTRNWSSRTKYFYQKTIEFAQKEGYPIKLNPLKMRVKTVGESQINPLEGFKDTALYIHTSRPLYAILKGMNAKSKNFVSEFIWSKIEDPMLKLEDLRLKDKSVSLNNGSGLPVKTKNSRRDNTASCEQVMKMLRELKEKIKIANFNLDDLIMHGSDQGTFRNRLKNGKGQLEVKQQVFAKTGTVRNTSSVAGYMFVDNSDEPLNFVILNHTTSSRVGRKFQDELLTKTYQKFKSKENTAYEYNKRSIFPLEGSFF